MEAAIIGMVGTSLLGFGSSMSAASAYRQESKFQARQVELEAKQEETAGIEREAERKRSLAKALASQISMAGAKGISAFEGSPLTIMQEDIRMESEDTASDRLQTELATLTRKMQASQTIQRGRTKARQIQIGAGASLLKNIGSVASVMPSGGALTQKAGMNSIQKFI